jgi:hypothetical protein
MSRELQANNGEPIPQRVVTVAAYTQPAVGANVTVSVNNARFYAANMQVSIVGGGTYNVVSVNDAADTMLLTNPSPALPQNAAPTTVVAAGATVFAGAVVPGTNGYSRVLKTDSTLANGTVTVQFTGVLNTASARAWATHRGIGASTGVSVLDAVATPPGGAGLVDVVVTARVEATTLANANDDSPITIFLLDS